MVYKPVFIYDFSKKISYLPLFYKKNISPNIFKNLLLLNNFWTLQPSLPQIYHPHCELFQLTYAKLLLIMDYEVEHTSWHLLKHFVMTYCCFCFSTTESVLAELLGQTDFSDMELLSTTLSLVTLSETSDTLLPIPDSDKDNFSAKPSVFSVLELLTGRSVWVVTVEAPDVIVGFVVLPATWARLWRRISSGPPP